MPLLREFVLLHFSPKSYHVSVTNIMNDYIDSNQKLEDVYFGKSQ